MRFYLTALAALILAAPATAAQPRTVHMYGDSITSGWGYGTYDSASPLNRIDRIATLLARANGSSLRFRKAGHQDPAAICRDVLTGKVRKHDSVVFEDAGPHTDQALGYRNWLGYVVFCARAKPALKTRLTLGTMFDYDPNPVSTPFATYDAVLPDGSGLTINDVTRQVARKHKTGLLDWNRLMDTAIRDLPGLMLVHPDGIHPTVFGNIVMAASILRREGVAVRNVGPLVDAIMADHDRIVTARFTPAFTRAQAEAWTQRLTGTR